MRTHTYTFALLEVSPAAYDEIKEKLTEAGYTHALNDRDELQPVDMHGIGIVRGAEVEGPLAKDHPESKCGQCGGVNVSWFAPNQLWNATVGSESGILCPTCFALEAFRRRTHLGVWRVVPETWNEPWAEDVVRGFLNAQLTKTLGQLAAARLLIATLEAELAGHAAGAKR